MPSLTLLVKHKSCLGSNRPDRLWFMASDFQQLLRGPAPFAEGVLKHDKSTLAVIRPHLFRRADHASGSSALSTSFKATTASDTLFCVLVFFPCALDFLSSAGVSEGVTLPFFWIAKSHDGVTEKAHFYKEEASIFCTFSFPRPASLLRSHVNAVIPYVPLLQHSHGGVLYTYSQ